MNCARQAAPARDRFSRRSSGAFTLFEVIIAIALIAIAGVLFSSNIDSLFRTTAIDELETSFWRAVAQAREQALQSRRPVAFSFDETEKHFLLRGASEFTHPLSEGATAENETPQIRFSTEVPQSEYILVRGELVTLRPVKSFRFFPDGSCQAITVDLIVGKEKRRITIDPWTCAMLTDPVSETQERAR